jgi:hypothetical protein
METLADSMAMQSMVVTYACPMPGPFDVRPWEPYTPPSPPIAPAPLTPERCNEIILGAMRRLDEFECMAAIDKLDDAAKRRVQAWLNARLDTQPNGK